MKTEIIETKDYNRFEMLGFNRDVKRTDSLEASMKRHGWIPAYPMHVVQNSKGKLKIKAGHHRFYVARKLGIPVQYVVCHDDATICELEESTNSWSLNDYLTSNIRNGKGSYQEIQEYCRRTGITISGALSLCGGHQTSTKEVKRFKKGIYELYGDDVPAEMVGGIVLCMKQAGVTWAATNLLVRALSKVILVEDFNEEVMKRQIEKYSYLITKQLSVYGYLRMLETVYNRSNRNRIPLAFCAVRRTRTTDRYEQVSCLQ
jgi:hypothetical protein